MFAILGSGFGLYGYLPALVWGCSQRVMLPARYRARFLDRSELVRFVGDVQWERDEYAALDKAVGVVLSLRPIDQLEWIYRCCKRPNLHHILLEKPLAPTPAAAARILDDLVHAGKVFRVGYIFRYTEWGKWLLQSLASIKEYGSLSINWSFMAHHFRIKSHNWKRFSTTGGGVIRFYGIHILALLAELGYREVGSSQVFGEYIDQPEKWIAIFYGADLPECKVVIDIKSPVDNFIVEQISCSHREQVSNCIFKLSNPFEYKCVSQDESFDQRVPLLIQLCRSLLKNDENDDATYNCYSATIDIWRATEKKNRFSRSWVK